MTHHMKRISEIVTVLWIVFVSVTYFIPPLLGPVPTSIFTAGYGIFLLIIVSIGMAQIIRQRDTKNNTNNINNGTEN